MLLSGIQGICIKRSVRRGPQDKILRGLRKLLGEKVFFGWDLNEYVVNEAGGYEVFMGDMV